MKGVVLASLGPAVSPWAGWLPLLWEEVTKGWSLGSWRHRWRARAGAHQVLGDLINDRRNRFR